MRYSALVAFYSLVALSASNAFGEEALTLGGLDNPVKLTNAELQQLMPGANMGRATTNGNSQRWFNDSDGTFVLSDLKSSGKSSSSSTRGKWNISDDRYCVVIEWKGSAEEWCRLVIKTTDGYYMAKSDKFPTEKVYKFEIKAK